MKPIIRISVMIIVKRVLNNKKKMMKKKNMKNRKFQKKVKLFTLLIITYNTDKKIAEELKNQGNDKFI